MSVVVCCEKLFAAQGIKHCAFEDIGRSRSMIHHDIVETG